MEAITIKQDTIIVLYDRPYNDKEDWLVKKLMPILELKPSIWEYLESNVLADILIAYKPKTKILVTETISSSYLDELKKFAFEHHLKLVCFNFGKYDGVKEDFSEFYSLKVEDKIDFFYEEDNSHLFKCNDKNYCVVGDIHGSFYEFKQMLADNKGIGFDKKTGRIIITDETKYLKHILVGDYIDKGDFKGIKSMIEFLYDNLEHFIICIGNHEYWVAEYLLGHQKPSLNNTKLIGDYFQTALLLLHNPELREKFFTIYNHSYHSVETIDAIITHSPCKEKYLRKVDEVALKGQRNLQYPKEDKSKSREELLKERNDFFLFLKEEADENKKYHLFGHTVVNEIFQFKNKICLDTGCVSGGELSTATFKEGKLTFNSYKSKKESSKERFPYFC